MENKHTPRPWRNNNFVIEGDWVSPHGKLRARNYSKGLYYLVCKSCRKWERVDEEVWAQIGVRSVFTKTGKKGECAVCGKTFRTVNSKVLCPFHDALERLKTEIEEAKPVSSRNTSGLTGVHKTRYGRYQAYRRFLDKNIFLATF